MYIYLANILIMIWVAYIFRKHPTGKLIFISIACIQWVLLGALRHETIGGRDVFISYKESYQSMSAISFSDILSTIKNVYIGDDNSKDPGFALIEKIGYELTPGYQSYLGYISLLVLIPLGFFVYKNSRHPFISMVVYSTLLYEFFSLTGFRQSIAVALTVFIGFEFIKSRKFIPYFIMVLAATTIHMSAIILIPFYFLSKIKISWPVVLGYLLISVLLLIFGRDFYAPYLEYFGYEYTLDNFLEGGYVFTAFAIMIAFVAIWRYPLMHAKNNEINVSLHAVLLVMVIGIMAHENQAFMRLHLYFSPFYMIIIPEIISTFNRKEKILVASIAMFTPIMLLVYKMPEYYFFWQI